MRAPNLVGRQFSRLTVIERDGYRGAKARWLCECVCGSKTHATTSDLNYGSIQSCGCLLAGPSAANVRHGHSGRNRPSSTYNSWRGMVERCTLASHVSFDRYGGRGISVCDRWLTFEKFLADMGERPPRRTIDRVDPDGNYEPGNCRWATGSEQRLNRSSYVVMEAVA